MLGLKWIIFVLLCIARCWAVDSYLGLFYQEDRDYKATTDDLQISGTKSGDPLHIRPSQENSTCKDHNEQCEKDSECCKIPDMFCWYPNSTSGIQNPPPYPLCKCNPMYQWSEKEWKCYPISLTQQMMMAAFMAFSVAILVALLAFCIHSCKYCWSYGERMRHMRDVRRDRRYRRRRQMRMPRRDQHSIPAFVEVDRDTPIKLPTYDEIGSDQIIFTTVPAARTEMSGTIRSLPPAYESIAALTNDTPIEGVTVVVPLQNSPERRDSRPQQQEGATNEAYQAENHI